MKAGPLAKVRKQLGLDAMVQNLGLRVLAAVLDAHHRAHELSDVGGRALAS